MYTHIRSWLLPAFFVFFACNVLATEVSLAKVRADELSISANPKWLSLLHIKEGDPQIIDSVFILSGTEFSPRKELYQTIELIFNDIKAARCRFPARYFLLDHFLNFASFGIEDIEECSELQKYKDFVPYDQLNLIYASEVLASASSMMGHSFLNAKGININQNEVSHSISFFTEIDSFNPFALIYDGLVAGMNGLFIVRPFDQDLRRYSETEGRNVWSYTLDINDFDQQLIKLHMWELKYPEIEYLFQSYNCATLTLYILSIAKPEMVDEDRLFVSPLDVVKAAEKHGLIKKVRVDLAQEWALKMLEQEIEPGLGKEVESAVFEGSQLQFHLLDHENRNFATEYLSRLIKNPQVKSQLGEQRISELTELVSLNSEGSTDIDLSRFKNPIKTPQDSILTNTIVFDADKTSIDFLFLPASHYLYGDNRQYFSESELKIGEFEIRVTPESSNLKLQSLTLYSFKSLVPSSKIVSKLSGSFHVGYRQILDKKLSENGFFDISGGLGKSVRLHKDVLLFSLLNVGLTTDISDLSLYASPSVGAIISTIGNGKIVFEYALYAEQLDRNDLIQTVSTEYAWLGVKNWTFRLAHKLSKSSSSIKNELQLGVGIHF